MGNNSLILGVDKAREAARLPKWPNEVWFHLSMQ